MAIIKLTLTNSSTVKKLLLLEPYAREYILNLNKPIEVFFDDTISSEIDIDILNNTLILHAWASVYCDGVELEPQFGVLPCE